MNTVIKFLQSEAERLPLCVTQEARAIIRYYRDSSEKHCRWGNGAVTDSQKFKLSDNPDQDFVHTVTKIHEDLIQRCLKDGHTSNMTGELVRHLGDGTAWFRVSSN